MARRLKMQADRESRLYDFLRAGMGLTKMHISRLKYTEGGILVNGVPARVTQLLKPGDTVDVDAGSVSQDGRQIKAVRGPLDILFEDADLIAVNKPAGTATHPAGIHQEDTVVNRLLYHFAEAGDPLIPHPVGRLDISTSGILLFAKNRAALSRMNKQRERGILKKEYTAIVSGCFEESDGEIELPLRRDPENVLKVIVSEDGKYAKTVYSVISGNDAAALLRVRILTGRMHQIRAHMAAVGHPLLGDALYGGSTERIGRAALHAGTMSFLHPFTGEKIVLTAPLPEDMASLL